MSSPHERTDIAAMRQQLADRAALLKNLPEGTPAWTNTLAECNALSAEIKNKTTPAPGRAPRARRNAVVVVLLLAALAVLLATDASHPGLITSGLLAGAALLAFVLP
ncbi:hypothetical protein [Yinghuangia seranimata]|uniref:hypothetical protein n=1 Tax=Yinghuangia seranimata TaxID=408067 RepID=UPI00248CB204|nr:hypothetical protein [Yinghuangia seranimata]MDI2130537.1 hypothetical protein [Yinghuangia seranimata]